MLPLLITLQYVNDGKNAVMARLSSEEKGATAVEYGLLVGLIAIAIVVTLVALGPRLDGLFQQVLNRLPAAPAAP
ncbi:Flp family type IVb pilin [Kocuria rosea]|uniref:Flp family type IVb pilin n=1 Tax=Kocuria rosea TaxID=1275 RepID=UPI00203B5189|nr:Flp family type IVb pilin [Kocuria rosea]